MKTTTLKSFIGPTIFSIAMGFMEAAIVVYLRELYYPIGFDFPIQPVQPMTTTILQTEVFREFCTIVMLLYMGYIHGKSKQEQFAYFLYCFAIWDIFYYVFLFLTIDWPASLFTWDLLFLIPIPWIGPVWSPVLVSLLMIALSFVLVRASYLGRKVRLTQFDWALLVTGSITIIISWTMDYMTFIYGQFGDLNFFAVSEQELNVVNESYVPQHFPWIIFFTGVAMILAAVVHFAFNAFTKPTLIHKQQTNSSK